MFRGGVGIRKFSWGVVIALGCTQVVLRFAENEKFMEIVTPHWCKQGGSNENRDLLRMERLVKTCIADKQIF